MPETTFLEIRFKGMYKEFHLYTDVYWLLALNQVLCSGLVRDEEQKQRSRKTQGTVSVLVEESRVLPRSSFVELSS